MNAIADIAPPGDARVAGDSQHFAHLPQSPVLLTPGPGTLSAEVHQAMTRDWGSWDEDFHRVTASVVADIEAIASSAATLRCVPLQGSGTFAVEAAVRTVVPPGGDLIVAVNGAYGQRLAAVARRAGRHPIVYQVAEDQPVDPQRIAHLLHTHPVAKHVAVIHCETSTGILNPLREIADVVSDAGAQLLVDAMSSFGALDVDADHPAMAAIVAASGKCLEGPPGVGLVLLHPQILAQHRECDSLSLDLVDQYRYLSTTGQWRFTPPTHVVAGLAQALRLYVAEGGRLGRLARYESNSRTLTQEMGRLGLRAFLSPAVQSPIIHTFLAPDHSRWSFAHFYQLVKERGFILYPGKLTERDTFRVGCIGSVDATTMRRACAAMGDALDAMGITLTPVPAAHHSPQGEH